MVLDKIPEIDSCYECDNEDYEIKFCGPKKTTEESDKAKFNLKDLVLTSSRVGIYTYILFRLLLKHASKVARLGKICMLISKYKNFGIIVCFLTSLCVNYVLKSTYTSNFFQIERNEE